jgi:tetratricopeptide (TPR) repeat protein
MLRIFAVALICWLLTAGAIAMASQDDPRLGPLFDRLHAATSPQEVGDIEQSIWRIWSESGDEGVDRVLRHGTGAMMARQFDSALISFNMVIERRPDFAEGWNKRATLYYLVGNYRASINDVERTLALEPRHFGALSGLGLIHMALGDAEQALEAFEAALAVHPHLQNSRRYVEQLRPQVFGPEI